MLVTFTYYIVLIIPNRVSEALGLTRNNSECFCLSGFLPELSAKIQKIPILSKEYRENRFYNQIVFVFLHHKGVTLLNIGEMT